VHPPFPPVLSDKIFFDVLSMERTPFSLNVRERFFSSCTGGYRPSMTKNFFSVVWLLDSVSSMLFDDRQPTWTSKMAFLRSALYVLPN